MPHVMCRPELHHATTSEQYELFHAEMEKLGLVRTLARDGKVFRLPSGLYLGVNVSSSREWFNAMITLQAIMTTGSAGKVAVWHIDDPANISVSGLEEVTPPSFYDELGMGAVSGLMNLWSK